MRGAGGGGWHWLRGLFVKNNWKFKNIIIFCFIKTCIKAVIWEQNSCKIFGYSMLKHYSVLALLKIKITALLNEAQPAGAVREVHIYALSLLICPYYIDNVVHRLMNVYSISFSKWMLCVFDKWRLNKLLNVNFTNWGPLPWILTCAHF